AAIPGHRWLRRPLPCLAHEALLECDPKGRAGLGLSRRVRPSPHELRQLFQLSFMFEELVELGVSPSPHGMPPRVARTFVTPRLISSFTAPGVLPMATAMSSILRSSWNFSTIAVRCCAGKVSITAQI